MHIDNTGPDKYAAIDLDGGFSCVSQSHLCEDYTVSFWIKLNSTDPCVNKNGIISGRMVNSAVGVVSEGLQIHCRNGGQWRYEQKPETLIFAIHIQDLGKIASGFQFGGNELKRGFRSIFILLQTISDLLHVLGLFHFRFKPLPQTYFCLLQK